MPQRQPFPHALITLPCLYTSQQTILPCHGACQTSKRKQRNGNHPFFWRGDLSLSAARYQRLTRADPNTLDPIPRVPFQSPLPKHRPSHFCGSHVFKIKLKSNQNLPHSSCTLFLQRSTHKAKPALQGWQATKQQDKRLGQIGRAGGVLQYCTSSYLFNCQSFLSSIQAAKRK